MIERRIWHEDAPDGAKFCNLRGGSLQVQLVRGRLRFNSVNRQLFKDGRDVAITRTEAAIIECLMEQAGSIVTHSQLAKFAWGEDYPDSVKRIWVHIRRLRQKIEDDPDNPQIICNRFGIGYILKT